MLNQLIANCLVCAAVLTLGACKQEQADIPLVGAPSPYLFMFLGDQDTQDDDFMAVLDIEDNSPTFGVPIASVPTGQRNSMPHHTEYETPPAGEYLFMNAHMPETTFLVDLSTPTDPKIISRMQPPEGLRFPHDYTRTPSGTLLVGYLRGAGAGPNSTEIRSPDNHGGIAEYTRDGTFIRSVSAKAPELASAMRPYAFALLPDMDRLVVTSAPMMENTWAEVVQIYSYTDFSLRHTLELPEGALPGGTEIVGSRSAGFGPRVLADGSVFLNTYGCAFYHLTDIASAAPTLEMVYAIETEPPQTEGTIRGACGIPVRINNFWVQPIGKLGQLMVLDLTDPTAPKEVMRLDMPTGFNPHWLAKDPNSNRLIIGAEFGGEEGFIMLRVDELTGRVAFDSDFQGKRPRFLWSKRVPGYISLTDKVWPHGDSEEAWGHAALFLPAAQD